MKHTTSILTLTALAAAASAQTTPAYGAKKTGLNYDRVSVGYSQNDSVKGYNVGFTAGFGDHLIVAGNYSDLSSRNLPVSIDGKGDSVGLGLKFTAGPGDIILSYSYAQVQLGGSLGTDVFLGAADGGVYGLNYRAALNSTVEINVGVSRSNVSGVVLAYDLTPPATVTTEVLSQESTDYNLGFRFNVTKQFDISAGYTYSSDNKGWNVSAGFNF